MIILNDEREGDDRPIYRCTRFEKLEESGFSKIDELIGQRRLCFEAVDGKYNFKIYASKDGKFAEDCSVSMIISDEDNHDICVWSDNGDMHGSSAQLFHNYDIYKSRISYIMHWQNR